MTIAELTDEVKGLKDEIKESVDDLTKQRLEYIEKAEVQEGVARANRKEDMSALTTSLTTALTTSLYTALATAMKDIITDVLGVDPEGWIFQADQYFSLHGITPAFKIPVVAARLKGDANSWYRWTKKSLTTPTWEEFCTFLGNRFADHKFINPHTALTKLTQTEIQHVPPNTTDLQQEQELKISLQSLMGSTFPNTMRIQGYIKAKPLTILVDSGATHNFLHPAIAKQCGYKIESYSSLCVTIGDADISGCDAVLGVQWLHTLGLISWDFTKLTMQLKINEEDIILRGNNFSSVMIMDVSPMQRLLCRETYGFLLQPSSLNTAINTTSVVPPMIQKLLSEYEDIFKIPNILPPERLHDHHIPLLPGSTPVNVRPYRYPYFQKDEIEKIVSELQQAGFIRPSSSPYSSPILMVRKKDGSWRMCVDYRALNKLTVKDIFPIPMVDELLDEMHGATIFSKLDFRFGYHQLRALLTFMLVFFDDILIYNKSLADYINHLSLVFDMIRTNKLFVKDSKCAFAQSSIGNLGHVISSEGVSVENDKIQCILSWTIPTTIKALRDFLDLAGYYRKFVRDFGKINAPLTQLLKKYAFFWTDKATAVFQQLQQALTSTPVLILPDFSKDFLLECEAFGNGLGVVLVQTNMPIAYYRKENVAVNALSRLHSSVFLLFAPIFSGLTDIIKECHDDTELSALIQQLRDNASCKIHFSYENGVLSYKGRIVVPSSSTWCTNLLEEFHSNPIGGHSGFLRTYKRLQQSFYWKVVVDANFPITVDYDKWEPDKILEREMFKRGNHAGTKWLVQRKDHPREEAT
ncbi:uncharacterized protein LOC113294724 [Papaver somniferum]|uniref:uncharacterized protein LOC113294724 n=1 Tax=Papaver somniferum TaxID=3469 RepID=UPI000E6F58F1|nr:uncharacterized protein LOC113294724 [Papaver somniferum]